MCNILQHSCPWRHRAGACTCTQSGSSCLRKVRRCSYKCQVRYSTRTWGGELFHTLRDIWHFCPSRASRISWSLSQPSQLPPPWQVSKMGTEAIPKRTSGQNSLGTPGKCLHICPLPEKEDRPGWWEKLCPNNAKGSFKPDSNAEANQRCKPDTTLTRVQEPSFSIPLSALIHLRTSKYHNDAGCNASRQHG